MTIATIFGQDEPPPPTTPGLRKGRGYEMDYGSALSYTINCKVPGSPDRDDVVLKGVAVRVNTQAMATVCFDTELLRYAAGWTNGFLDIARTHLNSSKGTHYAFVDGDLQFRTPSKAGWKGSAGVQATSTRYHGFYRGGDRICFSYAVNGIEILDVPGFQHLEGIGCFTRTLSIAPHSEPLYVSVPQPPATFKITGFGTRHDRIDFNSSPTKDGFVWIPPRTDHIVVTLTIGREKPKAPIAATSSPFDVSSFIRDGSARWPQILTTSGKLASGHPPYVVDTLTMPEQNPWKSWLRFVAFDFFSDGRAAISTWSGDVWIVSGIDDKLQKLTWKRYAAGLFEGLGLKIINDTVYVNARDRIVRLHDVNGDGEADFYESFNSDAPIGPSYHAFSFDLQTDRTGNFYYIRCGQRVDPALPLNGGLVKVSKDGTKTEMFAHGLRAANGMAIGPNDEIVCSDNQGNWTPSSRINLVKQGKFYGYVPHAHTSAVPTDYEKPICWLPMTIDNSSGGEAWVTSDRWGPFAGKLLHTSYGKASLMLLMTQIEGDRAQGGVVQFPLKFESGIMRARFHPLDGQLYVCGLRGWQTLVARDGAFQRVRHTGAPVHMPSAIKVVHDGIELEFTCELDRKTAEDSENYAVEAWNYKWTEAYGSPDFSVSHPDQKGHDKLSITSVHLESDRKRVTLKIPDLRPVMQMRVQIRIEAADATPISIEIYNTINWVP